MNCHRKKQEKTERNISVLRMPCKTVRQGGGEAIQVYGLSRYFYFPNSCLGLFAKLIPHLVNETPFGTLKLFSSHYVWLMRMFAALRKIEAVGNKTIQPPFFILIFLLPLS